MQEEFKDPQAQGQAIQWPKEKGQSLIYKTLHRKLSFPPQRYIFSQEAKIRFLFLDINKKSVNSLQIFIINFSLGTVGPD
jgi:hypothetical protein